MTALDYRTGADFAVKPGETPAEARKRKARIRSRLWKQENRPLYNDYMRRYRARQKAREARQKAPE